MEANPAIPTIIALLGVLSGIFLLFRIKLPALVDELEDYPKISIIIPARNEEMNIANLLSSIRTQDFKPYEVIVVNDNSTDRTKQIATNLSAIVVDSKPLPIGWKGKPFACWQGANKAKGDILLFLDADTIIEPGGMKRIADTYSLLSKSDEDKCGIVLSIAPYHKVVKLYENFSALFNIIMLASMNAFTPFANRQPSGLFGQSLMIRKEDYFSIGGHEAVKDKILENFFLAEKFKEFKKKLICLGGKNSLSFRMYPDGFITLIDGWTKAFASGASRTPGSLLTAIILWISAGFVVSIMLFAGILGDNYLIHWLVLYLIYAIEMYWMLHRIGSFRWFISLFFPILLLFYVIVFSRSFYYQLSRKSINWKARQVQS